MVLSQSGMLPVRAALVISLRAPAGVQGVLSRGRQQLAHVHSLVQY